MAVTWIVGTGLLVTLVLGLVWADCIDKTKDWNLEEDYECWLGDED